MRIRDPRPFTALNTRPQAQARLPRILFGVSPIGLGHATRALVLRDELKRRGAEVVMFSGGVAAEFIRGQGVRVEDIVDDPVPAFVNGEMRRASLWYIRSWLANRRTTPRTGRLFDSHPHDVVVCDEEFSGVVVAEKRREKRVFISDELELGFARTWIARKIEGRVGRWYRRLQDSVDLLIVTEEGEDSGNRRFVGPIVRPRTMSPQETRKRYALPEGSLVLVSLSGSGVGRELATALLEGLRRRGNHLPVVITGNRGPRITAAGSYDIGVVPDNQNLVAAADVVVSTAGKSTIDEAASAGTPIIAIPIRHHAEQERNAAALGYGSGDVGRLAELVESKIGKRMQPRAFSGEQKAADEILSLIPSA
jgi:UDP-N-acetylglucosamine--N-acetylmuramyl-(pentapeptide) pyrophosphoryl-undecaprenol N-acetylglucosamine transferase